MQKSAEAIAGVNTNRRAKPVIQKAVLSVSFWHRADFRDRQQPTHVDGQSCLEKMERFRHHHCLLSFIEWEDKSSLNFRNKNDRSSSYILPFQR
jgi:hypothetical protein